ncbi:MAG: hypothetical protein COB66_08145 [Coxiella sp. (in: Bacteria)]|nr:MAG: hypothetical protein COB66_08145 [Coxiella sp. (in: g-proteobacteria)]
MGKILNYKLCLVVLGLGLTHLCLADICPTNILRYSYRMSNWMIPPGWLERVRSGAVLENIGGVFTDSNRFKPILKSGYQKTFSNHYIIQVLLNRNSLEYFGKSSVSCTYIAYNGSTPTGIFEIKHFMSQKTSFKTQRYKWHEGMFPNSLACDIVWTPTLQRVDQCSWTQTHHNSRIVIWRTYLVDILGALAHAAY